MSTDLATAAATFLVDYQATHADGTGKNAEDYFRVNFLPFFGNFERFARASYSDYMRDRISRVTRTTLRKELSCLRMFIAWCGQRDVHLPPVPPLPKAGHPGTRSKRARKRKATIIEPAEAKRILVAMPERSRRTGCFVRPLFSLLWETGLRPTTVLKLSAPLNYRKAAKTLFINREIDKEGYERHVPLSAAARKALDRVVPKKGLLFDAAEGSLRDSLVAAVKAAGLVARRIGVYDFKHSRISIAANSGAPLAGVAFLVGHKHVSTTALYVQAGEHAARKALAIMERRGARKRRDPVRGRNVPVHAPSRRAG